MSGFKRQAERLLAIAGISSSSFRSNFIKVMHKTLQSKYSIAIDCSSPEDLKIIFWGESGEMLDCPRSSAFIFQSLIDDIQSEKTVFVDSTCGRSYFSDMADVLPGLKAIAGQSFTSSSGDICGVLLSISIIQLNDIGFVRELMDMLCVRLVSELERDKSEVELVLAKQRLDSLVSNTPLGIVDFNENYDVVQWNASCEKIFGFSSSEMVGQSVLDKVVPLSEIQDVKKYWEDLKIHPTNGFCLNKNITAGGREIICEWYITPMIDDIGALLGVTSLILDVTEWHRAMDTLLKSQKEQKDSLDALVDAVLIVDELGVIQQANKAVMNVFGYESFELIGENINLLILENESLERDGFLERYLSDQEDEIINIGGEVSGRQKLGGSIPIHLTVSGLPEGDNGERRFIGICHNLSLVKKQEEIIRRTQKMEAVGKLTSTVAHDFNNLLGIIQGYAELLKLKLVDDNKIFDYADQIHIASIRGANLTQKLLSVSKKNSVSPVLFDSREAIGANEYFIRSLIPKRISLRLDVSGLPCCMVSDKNDLNEAILNLCINAVHAISGEGEICICLHAENIDDTQAVKLNLPAGRYVTLKISDNGSGMDELTLEKIFDPFFTTKGEGGTGIGLSQVYAFVIRSNAFISVNSVLGEGSKFLLRFPFAEKGAVSGQSALMEEQDNTHVRSGTILVVDDEHSLCSIASDMLSDVGYHVLTAPNADEALRLLSFERIDLVLSDVIMSGMDGFELCKAIKQLYPLVQTIIASGYLGDDFDLSSIDKDVYSSVIRKPYSRSDLLAAVEKALSVGVI